MECSCSINAGVDDPVELISVKWVTAKSVHKCGECGKNMKPGEVYFRERYIFDEKFETCKTCHNCISIRRNLCGDWIYGQVRETISDAILDGLEIPEKCIAKLTPAARAWVCELIETEWERMDE